MYFAYPDLFPPFLLPAFEHFIAYLNVFQVNQGERVKTPSGLLFKMFFFTSTTCRRKDFAQVLIWIIQTMYFCHTSFSHCSLVYLSSKMISLWYMICKIPSSFSLLLVLTFMSFPVSFSQEFGTFFLVMRTLNFFWSFTSF